MNQMTRLVQVPLILILVAYFISSSSGFLSSSDSNRIQVRACSGPAAIKTRRFTGTKTGTDTSTGSTRTLQRRPPLPDINFGWTDAEFRSWLVAELENVPGRETYSDVYEEAMDAIVKWRQRYRGNPQVWKRIFKKDRVLKELAENAPILSHVRKVVKSYNLDEDGDDKQKKKITIMDLCSGKGYMSMFLSEMLPPEKVDKFILIDKAWAMCNAKEVKPHHMNWDHIYGTLPNNDYDDGMDSVPDDETYFTTWPIPLHTSKQDLKQSCNQRQMKKYIFDRVDGPIIILAVHLCGTLSLKAVDMFNHHDHVKFFALKPCCLPSMIYAQRGDTFQIGSHEFDAKEVCSNGSFNKKEWNGPPRWHLENKFNVWADHLFRGVEITPSVSYSEDVNDDRILYTTDNGKKEKREIVIQVDGGFQNTYIFAERSPMTPSIWID